MPEINCVVISTNENDAIRRHINTAEPARQMISHRGGKKEGVHIYIRCFESADDNRSGDRTLDVRSKMWGEVSRCGSARANEEGEVVKLIALIVSNYHRQTVPHCFRILNVRREQLNFTFVWAFNLSCTEARPFIKWVKNTCCIQLSLSGVLSLIYTERGSARAECAQNF